MFFYFISGLPTLFVEKIRQRIRNIHNGRIPYELLTYGELITFINNECLALCTDLKLKSQMKKKKKNKKEKINKIIWKIKNLQQSQNSKRNL